MAFFNGSRGDKIGSGAVVAARSDAWLGGLVDPPRSPPASPTFSPLAHQHYKVQHKVQQFVPCRATGRERSMGCATCDATNTRVVLVLPGRSLASTHVAAPHLESESWKGEEGRTSIAASFVQITPASSHSGRAGLRCRRETPGRAAHSKDSNSSRKEQTYHHRSHNRCRLLSRHVARRPGMQFPGNPWHVR